mmetsp:Transcript_63227/g.124532  ORF Transcript_63227/g.124532 Transcript_63227/m.124532 type:complete len:209 (-) Transcript_63227:259-885(-)
MSRHSDQLEEERRQRLHGSPCGGNLREGGPLSVAEATEQGVRGAAGVVVAHDQDVLGAQVSVRAAHDQRVIRGLRDVGEQPDAGAERDLLDRLIEHQVLQVALGSLEEEEDLLAGLHLLRLGRAVHRHDPRVVLQQHQVVELVVEREELVEVAGLDPLHDDPDARVLAQTPCGNQRGLAAGDHLQPLQVVAPLLGQLHEPRDIQLLHR